MSLADPTPILANIEAEAALLGALMIDNRLMLNAADQLGVDDFAEPLHARIYGVMLKLHARDRLITPVTLRPFFDADTGMRDLGGPGYLAQLTGSGAAVIGATGYIEQLKDLSGRRRACGLLLDGVDRIKAQLEEPLSDQLAILDSELWSSTATIDPIRPSSAAEMVRKALERNQRIETSERGVGARCLFIPELDRVLGPLEPGYHIIAARPGMGKSTLAESAVLGYAANGHASEYLMWEMTEEQMALRITSDLTQWIGQPIEHKRLKEGNLTSSELQAVERAEAIAEQLPMEFTAAEGWAIHQVDSYIARAKSKWARRGKKLEVVVLDYLQLIECIANGRTITNKFDRIIAVSRALRSLWKKHGVALLVLAQVGRAVEDRKDKRPQLNDIKDAGDIEQDADTVTFVFREEVYLMREQPPKRAEINDQLRQAWEADLEIARGKAELIGAKNRHGKPQTRVIRFIGEHYAMRSENHVGNAADDPALDLFGRGS